MADSKRGINASMVNVIEGPPPGTFRSAVTASAT